MLSLFNRQNRVPFSIMVVVLLLIIGFRIRAGQAYPLPGGTVDKVDETEISLAFIIPGPGIGNQETFLRKLGNLILGKERPLFSKPVSITATDSTLIRVADQGYGEVIETGISEKSTKKLFGAREERLPSLAGICQFGNDSILFTDSATGHIYLKHSGSPYRLFNENLQLNQPTGIAVSPVTGEIWVIETGSHRIAVLDRTGNRIKTVGSRGTLPSEFNYPTHIWIDCNGDVYIVDALNFRIQIFDSEANFQTMFGEQGDATGYFARPKGIATDSKGNIYIADALFNAVQVFDRDGKFLHYFGSQGNGEEEFWMPSGVYIDKNDFLYIADSYNTRIKVYKIVHR